MKQLIHQNIIDQCRKSLLQLKRDVLNRFQYAQKQFTFSERSGDEIDQTVALLEENSFLINQERLRNHLLEIEFALARIEQGKYGICEETEEPIEVERLLAIPWTRLSIEGAEIREVMTKKYALNR